jgi:hypothetical protein
LRKYYPRNAGINKKNKAIYMVLLLDPRIKQEGLEGIGISHRQAVDTYNKLYEEYTRLVYFLIIFF